MHEWINSIGLEGDTKDVEIANISCAWHKVRTQQAAADEAEAAASKAKAEKAKAAAREKENVAANQQDQPLPLVEDSEDEGEGWQAQMAELPGWQVRKGKQKAKADRPTQSVLGSFTNEPEEVDQDAEAPPEDGIDLAGWSHYEKTYGGEHGMKVG